MPTVFSQEIVQTQKIVASDREMREHFGQHVQIYDDFAFVSAPMEGVKLEQGGSTSGAVYVYKIDAAGHWNETQKLVGSGNDYVDNFGSGIERSGNTLIIGAHSHKYNGAEYAGAAYIFDLDIYGNWIETQKLVASDYNAGAHFGIDVAISGAYVLVGSYAEKLDAQGKNPLREAGAAYIFKRDVSGRWIQQKKIVSPGRIQNGRFGLTVYLSGNNAAVGAVFEGSGTCGLQNVDKAGVVYMYEVNDRGEWNFIQKITHSNREANDSFGGEIILSAKDMFVSSLYKVVDGKQVAGTVYYYHKGENGLWCEKQKITSPEPLEKDYFGHSVAIYNDLLLIGGGWWNKIGTGYLFKRNDCGNWIFYRKINASGTDAQLDDKDNFGGYVSLSKNHVIIGADDDDHAPNKNVATDAGSAFIFDLIDFDSIRLACDADQAILTKFCSPCGTSTQQEDTPDEVNPNNPSDRNAQFIISPNPNNGQFTIEVIGFMDGHYPVKIKKSYRTVKTLTLLEKTTNIDLGRDAKGVYFVKIITKEGVRTIPVYVEQKASESRSN